MDVAAGSHFEELQRMTTVFRILTFILLLNHRTTCYPRRLAKVSPAEPVVCDALRFSLKDIRGIVGVPLDGVSEALHNAPQNNTAAPNVFHHVVCRIDES